MDEAGVSNVLLLLLQDLSDVPGFMLTHAPLFYLIQAGQDQLAVCIHTFMRSSICEYA